MRFGVPVLRWAQVVAVGVVLAAGVMVAPDRAAAAPDRAAAAPTPEPSPPAVCSVPDGPARSIVPGSAQPPQVAWCLPWARWDDGRGWVTECSEADSAVDQDRCDAVSITLASPPPDGTPSVLDDRFPPSGEPAVRCEQFADRAAEGGGDAPRWAAKEDRCRALRESLLPYSSLRSNQGCGLLDVGCQVGSQVEQAARAGFAGLADVAVAGFAWALSKLAEVVFVESSATADEAFYGVYNDLSGVLIIMVMLIFIISTAINGLRLSGPGPLSTLGGLVRAIFGIAFVGGVAYLLMAAWDEATVALISRNQERDWQPSLWVEALNGLTADTGTILFAFVVAVIGVVGLVLVFVMLMFRSLLAAGAALFGAMAMTGQVMTETRSWGRKWFWTCNALASSKFFVAALWIYGTRTAYESDDVLNVLRGMFVIVLMVLAPWILLRLTSMWDGYLADVDARGFLTSAATAVGLDATRRLADPGTDGGGDGGGDEGAARLMTGNADVIPTSPGSGPDVFGTRMVPEAVEASQGRGDSGQVGAPAAGPGESGNGENAGEAAGVEQDSRTAQGDVAQGQVTLPGDATGRDGAVPVTPRAALDDQTSPPPAARDQHTPPIGESGATHSTPNGPTSPPAGDDPPSATPNNGDAAGPAAGGRGGAAAGGRGAAAAGGAAEIPIVPI
ncbi:hypothetical protein [Micromonospora sp. SH-82]|uniref:hypothetical protein n=1 Tax=Micromonospora sp. SH-82 TaxID=3132938 RepID=UPI003EB70985